MSSKNHIFSEGPNGFSGWRPFTKNLIFSRRLTTSLFSMSNSDNSNSNNNNSNTQQKKPEVEEITKMQYLHEIAKAEAEAKEEEKEIDLTHIKFHPYNHLPAKLYHKQIQEFQEKGIKTPKEQLNWLNANKLWNSLDQDQKCLLAAHLLGDELFAEGDKQALHLFIDDDKPNDDTITIQCATWWDDLEKKLADLKKPKMAKHIQKKFDYRQNNRDGLPFDVIKFSLYQYLDQYRSEYTNNKALLGELTPEDPKNIDEMNEIIEADHPELSKEQQNAISELTIAYRKIYPLSTFADAYAHARERIVTVMEEHKYLEHVPPLIELLTEEENVKYAQKMEEERQEEENAKEYLISSTADILQRINPEMSRKEAMADADSRLFHKMFDDKKTAREIFSKELLSSEELKKWESSTKEIQSIIEIQEDSDDVDKDVDDVLEILNKLPEKDEKDLTAPEKDEKDQPKPEKDEKDLTAPEKDNEDESEKNLIFTTSRKFQKLYLEKTNQEINDEVQKRLNVKMKGNRKASRIFPDELLNDDEKERWSTIEDNYTHQFDEKISKEVTTNVLFDLQTENDSLVLPPPGMSKEDWARMNADPNKLKADIYKKLQDLPPPPPPQPENWRELPQTHKWGNIQEFTSDQKAQKEIQLRNELIEFFKKRYNGNEDLANEVVHARIAEFQKKTPNVSWFKFHIDNFLTSVERQDLHTEPVPPNVQEVDEK